MLTMKPLWLNLATIKRDLDDFYYFDVLNIFLVAGRGSISVIKISIPFLQKGYI